MSTVHINMILRHINMMLRALTKLEKREGKQLKIIMHGDGKIKVL